MSYSGVCAREVSFARGNVLLPTISVYMPYRHVPTIIVLLRSRARGIILLLHPTSRKQLTLFFVAAREGRLRLPQSPAVVKPSQKRACHF